MPFMGWFFFFLTDFINILGLFSAEPSCGVGVRMMKELDVDSEGSRGLNVSTEDSAVRLFQTVRLSL